MKPKIFSFYSPHEAPLKGILSIPHSGEWIPDEFRPYMTSNQRDLDQDLDYRVDELVDIPALCAVGVGVVVSHIHRTCIDINRAPETAVFAWKENTQGVKLIHSLPKPEFIEKSLGRYHVPYFEMLRGLIYEGIKSGNPAFPVIDLHSMPSAPTAYHLQKNPNQEKVRKDFCISDLRGTSCTPEYLEQAVNLFSKSNSVAVNDPYFGGYVTQFFHTFEGINALQIEINRRIYMDEERIELYPEKVETLKPILTNYLKNIFT